MATFRKPFSKEVALLGLLAAFVASAYGVYAWRDKKEEAFSNLDNLALMSARLSALFFRHFELSLQTLSQDIVATKSRLDTPEVHDLLVRFQTNDERLAVSNLFSTDGQSLSSSNLAVGQRILDTTRNVGLLRDDGVLQGRWPEVTDPDRVYAAPNNGFLLDKLRGEGFPDSGRAEGRGTLVDAQRLIAFHRVPGYPLTAFVAIPNSAGWREWIETVWLPFLLFALMAGCSVWIYRYGSRHRALWEQELQARQSGLEFRNEISGHAIQGLGMEELVRIVVLETVKHFHGMWCAYSTVDAQGLLQVKESSQTEGGPSLDGRWICPSSPPTSPRCATRSRSF